MSNAARILPAVGQALQGRNIVRVGPENDNMDDLQMELANIVD
jgi:hypothetical protein